jgi:phosphate-selective porin OprO/OprP
MLARIRYAVLLTSCLFGAVALNAALTLSPADAAVAIRASLQIQFDLRHFLDDADGRSALVARRVRPSIRVESGPIEIRVTPELTRNPRLVDAWADFALTGPALTLRAGKFKGPIGHEVLQSSSDLLFIERGMQANLTPSRVIGAQLQGATRNGALNWTAGLYKGALDATEADLDHLGDDFDAGFRLALRPFAARSGGDLTIGLGATVGRANRLIDNSDEDQRIRYRSSGRTAFFRYRDGLVADGQRIRVNPFAHWYRGRLGVLAEGIRSISELRGGDGSHRQTTDAWLLQGSWVLTGERAGYGQLRPARPVGVGGGWGAWELGLRWHVLQTDRNAFVGLAPLAHPAAVQRAEALAIGLKWYLTDQLLLAVIAERKAFSGAGVKRSDADLILTRLQVRY